MTIIQSLCKLKFWSKQEIENQVNLPREVKVNIMTRLPAELLYLFAQKSAHLRNLISSESFVDSHLKNSSTLWQSFQGLNCSISYEELKFAFKFIDHRSGKMVKKNFYVHRQDGQQVFGCCPNLRQHGSCNGLLLFASDHRYIILNPITGEYLTVERPEKIHSLMNHGLFFNPQMKDYQLFFSRRLTKTEYEFMIYSSKRRSWTVLTKRNPYAPRYDTPAVVVNGLLHWLAMYSSPGILTFDMDNEKWGVIAIPETLLHCQPDPQLRESENQLCLCDVRKLEGIEIWVLEDYSKKGWVKRYVINLLDAKQYFAESVLHTFFVQIVKFDRDRVWVRCESTYLSHDFRCNTWTKISSKLINFDMCVHTNSLVSIRRG